MDNRPIIGIVGGVGPYAGLDLGRKVFNQTRASTDQDHLNVLLVSLPREIPDRTAYLLGNSDADPVPGLLRCLRILESAGATVAGIACNTAHTPRLFQRVLSKLSDGGSRIRVLNMVQEVAEFLLRHYPAIRRVGVLATNGTIATNVYGDALDAAGLETLYPDATVQRCLVHEAIYNTTYGIKACSEKISERARDDVLNAARHLVEDKSADALILGCTELPLAVPERSLFGKPLIDASLVLARALVASVEPEKLVPFVDGSGSYASNGTGRTT